MRKTSKVRLPCLTDYTQSMWLYCNLYDRILSPFNASNTGARVCDGGLELVTVAPHGLDVAGTVRLFFDLGSDPHDVHVERSCVAAVIVAPDFRQQPFPGHQPARIAHQDFENVELLSRELDEPASDVHLAPPSVQLEDAGDEWGVLSRTQRGPASPDAGPDPEDELSKGTRRRDAVVCATLNCGNPLGLRGAGSKDNNRHGRRGSNQPA